MKTIHLLVCLGLMWGTAPAFANTLLCEKAATDKKLAGAAYQAHVAACTKASRVPGSAQARCEKAATDLKKAGAAKTSNIRKCLDAAAAKP
jgi:hypothetical protein